MRRERVRGCEDRCLPNVLQRDEASAVDEEVPETGWHCLLRIGLREVAISLHLNMLTSWNKHRHQKDTGTGLCPDCLEIVEIIFLPIIIDD